MESKYKERAKELVVTLFEDEPCNWEDESIENDFLKLMCQLAEEVEQTRQQGIDREKDKLIRTQMLTIANSYTKEQVEELLQKQREFCAEESSTVLVDYGIGEFREVDKDSILNAKLKID